MSSAGTWRAPDRFRRLWWFFAVVSVGLSACAPEVVRRPAQLVPTGGSSDTIEILEDASVAVGPGYRRVISRGSVWNRVGHTGEGDVYKRVDGVFTAEGAQIHEAYLVLSSGHVGTRPQVPAGVATTAKRG